MLSAFADNIVYWVCVLTTVLGLMTIAEILWGRDRLTIPERLKGLPFWGAQIIVRAAVMLVTLDLGASLGVTPILHPFSPGMNIVAATVIVVLAFDFSFYVFHRIQHRFLWCWHAPHHSFRTLTAINSHHHWTDPILSTFLISIPMAFVEWPGQTLPFVSGLMTFQAYAIHSNLRFDLGPLQKILVGPAYHRIHHSLDGEHIDKNFGAFIPLWDWLFGTLVWPDKQARPAVGVADFPEPTLGEWWLAPIRPPRRSEEEAQTPAQSQLEPLHFQFDGKSIQSPSGRA